MKKKSAKDRGGNLGGSGNLVGGFRGRTRKSIIDDAMQLPFQGIARVGQGKDCVTFRAGLFMGKTKASAGVKIRF